MFLLFKKRNNFLFIIALLCFFFPAIAQTQEIRLNEEGEYYLFQGKEDIVRGFIWGLSKEFITEQEKATFVGEEDNILFFLDNILGVRSTIGYEFQDDKLMRVRIFNERHYLEQQQRIEDLISYKKILEERYGTPFSEDFIWRNEFEKNFPDNWGWAVYRGHLDIKILWQTEESRILLLLESPKQYEPQMSITFEEKGSEVENLAPPGLQAPL